MDCTDPEKRQKLMCGKGSFEISKNLKNSIFSITIVATIPVIFVTMTIFLFVGGEHFQKRECRKMR